MPPKRLHHKTYSSEISPSQLFCYHTHRDSPKISKSPTLQFDFKTSLKIDWFHIQIFNKYNNSYIFQLLSEEISQKQFQQQDLASIKFKSNIKKQMQQFDSFQSQLLIKLFCKIIDKGFQNIQNKLKNQIKSYSNQHQQTNTSKLNLILNKILKTILQVQEQKLKIINNLCQFQNYVKNSKKPHKHNNQKNILYLQNKKLIFLLDIQQKQQVENLYNNQFHKSHESFNTQGQKISLLQNQIHSKCNRLVITPILQFHTPKETLLQGIRLFFFWFYNIKCSKQHCKLNCQPKLFNIWLTSLGEKQRKF